MNLNLPTFKNEVFSNLFEPETFSLTNIKNSLWGSRKNSLKSDSPNNILLTDKDYCYLDSKHVLREKSEIKKNQTNLQKDKSRIKFEAAGLKPNYEGEMCILSSNSKGITRTQQGNGVVMVMRKESTKEIERLLNWKDKQINLLENEILRLNKTVLEKDTREQESRKQREEISKEYQAVGNY